MRDAGVAATGAACTHEAYYHVPRVGRDHVFVSGRNQKVAGGHSEGKSPFHLTTGHFGLDR